MPTPATVPDLLDLIRRSGVLDTARLERVTIDCSQSADAACPVALLGQFVADGVLTSYQADQFAQGRWQGFLVGEYRILTRLGAGGMSQVYLAEHATTRQQVAVKILLQRLATDTVARERFAREAHALAALNHPNVVQVQNVDVHAALPYLVMEYIAGITLQSAVARHGTFAAGTAAFCGHQVALGLHRAFEAGLVHRDIKPANVLIDRSGRAKILDMGIVRMNSDKHLTQRLGEKTILGTADYLAPEQAVNSSAVDARADLYSLGATLYFLLAGHPPFPHGTPVEKIIRKQKDDPLPIDRLRPDVPPKLSAVVMRLLARKPEGRFATPQAAAAALAPFAVPDSRFPGRLFEAPPGPLDDSTPTPTHTDRAGTPPDGTAEPTTDVVTMGQDDPPTAEVTDPLTAQPASVTMSGTLGMWLAATALIAAMLTISALILVARLR